MPIDESDRRATLRRAIACFLGCGAAMLLVGAVSVAAGAPLLFPAIGASAFIAFAVPESPFARPRSVLLGHGIGAAVGLACAFAFGVVAHEPWLLTDEPWRAAASASLALAVTSPAMLLLRAMHPPAGATTLIFGTGLLGGVTDLGAVLVSATVLLGFAAVVRRIAVGTAPVRA